VALRAPLGRFPRGGAHRGAAHRSRRGGRAHDRVGAHAAEGKQDSAARGIAKVCHGPKKSPNKSRGMPGSIAGRGPCSSDGP
jgi:hypothetical protein